MATPIEKGSRSRYAGTPFANPPDCCLTHGPKMRTICTPKGAPARLTGVTGRTREEGPGMFGYCQLVTATIFEIILLHHT